MWANPTVKVLLSVPPRPGAPSKVIHAFEGATVAKKGARNMTDSPSGAQLGSPFHKRAGRAPLAALLGGILAVVGVATGADAAPATCTQAQVDASVAKAV